ncbi:MAG TPA: hypothetical protein VJV79_06255 [Polyangiaceae bacterium]|nr:hypothetical protein [Polyangiaceae bacterium]
MTTPFATVSPFKSVLRRGWERLVLAGASVSRQPEPTMRERRFLHHAYWLRLLPASLRASGTARVSGPGALLFLSSFTGNQPDYLRGFTASLPMEMDLIWDCSTDWPGAANNSECAKFIGKYQQSSQMYFIAYGDAGVRDVRLALLARAKLDEFATEFADASDQQFESAFERLATAILTDPDGRPPELS